MNMDIDVHLTQLLSSMTLDGTSRWGSAGIASEGQATSPTVGHQDATMSDASDTEDSSYQPRSPSASSSCTKTADEPPPCGCALLQWLRGQLQAGQYATTGGDYLEIILTHRDAFYAFPDGHRTCAIGFSDIALDLERRETRPDRESDPEAAAAFRHEAIVIASSGIWSQPTI